VPPLSTGRPVTARHAPPALLVHRFPRVYICPRPA